MDTAAPAWQPNEQGLQQIVAVFRNADSPDNRIQLQVRQQLADFAASIPDYNNYLMYIQTCLTQESESVRAMAGLVLKNNLKAAAATLSAPGQAAHLHFIKQCCLNSIGDQSALVRSTIGNVVTTIVTAVGIQEWPELLPRLMDLLSSADQAVVEGAFSALLKICEDSGEFLVNSPSRPLDVMIPRFVQLADSEHEQIRIYALSCTNQFFIYKSPALFDHVEKYIQTLSRRAADSSGSVRRLVCNAFVMMLDARPDIIMPQVQSIAQFIMFAMQDADENVALEAAEFWLAFAERDELREYLLPMLPGLLPVLLTKMVYSDADILLLGEHDDENDKNNGNHADRPDDIKPRHHKAKTHEINKQQPASGAKNHSDGDESDDDDDDEDDDGFADWNIRKCCAATLDVVSTVFGSSILTVLLPLLNANLFSADWKQREAGILALGAIADGCMTGVEPHLPQLAPYLFERLQEPKPLVRSITCWTLSRYAAWCIAPSDGTVDKSRYFEPLLQGLLLKIQDGHKKVQEAACSAFAALEEEAMEELVPYLPHIVPVLVQAFSVYQRKNLIILYDAVSTLAESVESALAQPQFVNLIMPPLIERWHHLTDEDTGLFPLLECLSAVAIALGPTFEPFAGPVYERCIRLVQRTLTATALHEQNPAANEAPDGDFMIVALDLLSGIIQGLGNGSRRLVMEVKPSLFELLQYTVRDQIAEVRQSSFALVGDLASTCFDDLRAHLPVLVPIIIEQIHTNLSPADYSACNNACWAIGEIAIRLGTDMAPFVAQLPERLIALLKATEVSRTLQENAAIALGRLGLVIASQISPHLEHFAGQWCKVLRHSTNNDEKESAYFGLCEMIKLNPNGLIPALPLFCDSVANWTHPSPKLHDTFKRVLCGYKTMMGAQWQPYFSKFPAPLRQQLAQYVD